MKFQLSVVEVNHVPVCGKRVSVEGFRVTGLYREPFFDMWQRIDHPVYFRTKERAEAFLNRVIASHKVNLKNWICARDSISGMGGENPAPYSVI